MINTLLRLDILRTVTELREQQVEKTFSPLKKQIDKIAAGVKGICYLAAESPSNYGVHVSLDCNIKTELNEYVRQKYSYDFNARNGNWNLSLLILSNNHLEDINRIFQKALFDDDEFWSGHKNFNILTFIEVVSDVNDARHTEKIIDHIFAEISKTQYGKAIIEKSLPLVFLKKDDFLYGLEWRTFRFTFERFKGYYDLQTVSQEHLCYPFAQVSDAENKLIKGKQLIEDFLRVIYPNDFLRILGILKAEITAPSSGFSCKKQALCNNNGKLEVSDKDFDEWNIQHIFDYPTFGYHTKIIDREAVSVYCQEYFFAENIWNRLYLKAYYMFELEKNKKKCFANLFEVYYDLFQFIEEKTGIKTSYQRNTEGRNEAYSQLETMLKQYGFDGFCKRHKNCCFNTVPEYSGDMENSYLMINPQGEFQLNDGGKYEIYGNCIKEGLDDILSRIPFRIDRFDFRYGKDSKPEKITKKVYVFGGHPTWLKVIKDRMVNAKFFKDGNLHSLDVIRNADEIWIQPNAISHSFYGKVIDAARSNKIPVRYFEFAGTKKCLEQVISKEAL